MSLKLATVVIVEDDVAARTAIARLLVSQGFGVLEYSTAEEYWAGTRDSTALCVLIDIDLGDGMSGLELADTIRRSSHALPVIFMTGSAQAALRLLASKLGAVAFFEKPARADELLAVVRNLRDLP